MRLGVFIIIGTILIMTAIYMIGSEENIFRKTFSISSVYNNVNGLQVGNNVRYSGIKVGVVKSIEMEQNSKIRVTMSIEQKMLPYIKKDAIASIGSDGLVGNMIVNITPGSENLIPVDDGDEIQSYSRIGTEDILKTLNNTNDNAALLISNLLQITQSLMEGKGTLGKLLNDTLMANDLEYSIKNLRYASAEANNSLKELNGIIKSIDFDNSVAGKLLKDSISAQKVVFIIENMEASSVEIEKISSELHQFINEISSADGALKYLAKDSLFVQKLESTIQNIEQGTGRFNENMEALKHHFLFRGYFKKLEKEEAKALKKSQKN